MTSRARPDVVAACDASAETASSTAAATATTRQGPATLARLSVEERHLWQQLRPLRPVLCFSDEALCRLVIVKKRFDACLETAIRFQLLSELYRLRSTPMHRLRSAVGTGWIFPGCVRRLRRAAPGERPQEPEMALVDGSLPVCVRLSRMTPCMDIDDVSRGVFVVVEWLLTAWPDAVRCGVSFLIDASGAATQMVERLVVQQMGNKLLAVFANDTYPVRVRRIHVYRCPSVLGLALRAAKGFLGTKLAGRVTIERGTGGLDGTVVLAGGIAALDRENAAAEAAEARARSHSELRSYGDPFIDSPLPPSPSVAARNNGSGIDAASPISRFRLWWEYEILPLALNDSDALQALVASTPTPNRLRHAYGGGADGADADERTPEQIERLRAFRQPKGSAAAAASNVSCISSISADGDSDDPDRSIAVPAPPPPPPTGPRVVRLVPFLVEQLSPPRAAPASPQLPLQVEIIEVVAPQLQPKRDEPEPDEEEEEVPLAVTAVEPEAQGSPASELSPVASAAGVACDNGSIVSGADADDDDDEGPIPRRCLFQSTPSKTEGPIAPPAVMPAVAAVAPSSHVDASSEVMAVPRTRPAAALRSRAPKLQPIVAAAPVVVAAPGVVATTSVVAAPLISTSPVEEPVPLSVLALPPVVVTAATPVAANRVPAVSPPRSPTSRMATEMGAFKTTEVGATDFTQSSSSASSGQAGGLQAGSGLGNGRNPLSPPETPEPSTLDTSAVQSRSESPSPPNAAFLAMRRRSRDPNGPAPFVVVPLTVPALPPLPATRSVSGASSVESRSNSVRFPGAGRGGVDTDDSLLLDSDGEGEALDAKAYRQLLDERARRRRERGGADAATQSPTSTPLNGLGTPSGDFKQKLELRRRNSMRLMQKYGAGVSDAAAATVGAVAGLTGSMTAMTAAVTSGSTEMTGSFARSDGAGRGGSDVAVGALPEARVRRIVAARAEVEQELSQLDRERENATMEEVADF